METNKRKYYLLVIFAGMFWGTTGLFFRKLTSMGFESLEVLLLRIGFAALLLGGLLLIKDRKLFRIRLKDLFFLAGAGIFTFSAFFCYFSALSNTTVAVSAVLLYTSPAFVVLFSAFLFKERITAKKLLALLLIFGGCVFSSGLFESSQTVTFLGLFWGVMSGVTYALYSVFNRYSLSRGYDGFTITFYAMLIGTVIALCVVDLPTMAAKMTLPGLGFGLGIGFCCAMMPFLLYTLGMSGLETGEAAMLSTVELIVATILSALVLSEPLTFFIALGVVLIIVGIVVMNMKTRGAKEK